MNSGAFYILLRQTYLPRKIFLLSGSAAEAWMIWEEEVMVV